MKPIRLVIDGINSFSERQEIQFDKLMENGLFGIFGNTGSGKSTILDGIFIALYGALKGRDKAEFINKRVNKASVEFEFSIICEGKRKHFIVIRSFTLTKKKELGKTEGWLQEVCDDGSIIQLAEKTSEVTNKINEIIGLDENEFKKCIALPQGEFSTFATNKDGRRMETVGKLFPIEKYGKKLTAKVSQYRNEILNEKQANEIVLNTYEEYRTEKLEEAKIALNNLETHILNLKEEVKKRTEAFNNYNHIRIKAEELNNAEKEKETLLAQKTDVDVKKEKLKLFNICFEIYEKRNELNDKIEKKSQLKNNNEKITLEIDRLTKEKLKTENELTKYSNELIIANNTKIIRINEIIPRLRRIEEFENEYKTKYKDLSKLNENIHKNEIEIVKKESSIESLREINDILGEYISKAQSEENSSFLDYLKEKRIYAQKYDASPLKEDLLKEIDSKCEKLLFRIQELEMVSENYDAFSELKKYEEIRKNNEVINKEIAKLRERVDNDKRDAERLKTEIQDIIDTGKKERDEANQQAKQAGFVIKTKDDAEMHKKVLENENKNIIEQNKNNTKKINIFANSISQYSIDFSKNDGQVIELQNSISAIEQQLNGIYEKHKLDRDYIDSLDFADFDCEKIQEEIKEYDKKLSITENNIKKLNCENGVVDFSYEKLAELKKLLEETDTNEKNALIDITTCKNNIKEWTQKLEEKDKYEKKQAEIIQRLSVAEKLNELMKGDKFYEFVTDEYLREIAGEAAKTLLLLTRGKYDLDYADKNFVVLDNLNGGERRSVSTLSGGELFLVSLSLALGLANEILNEASKPIEFFFLDEGFGTLDEELIDIVIDALEKLKNNRYGIGLISHVNELKQRLTSQIRVSGATETQGSRIEVVL